MSGKVTTSNEPSGKSTEQCNDALRERSPNCPVEIMRLQDDDCHPQDFDTYLVHDHAVDVPLPNPRWQVTIYYCYAGESLTYGPHEHEAHSQIEADTRAMLAFLEEHQDFDKTQLSAWYSDSKLMSFGIQQFYQLLESIEAARG